MTSFRAWTKRHCVLALWLIAAALLVKALVPQGYMVVPGKTLTLAICSGTGPAEMTVTLPVAPGKGDPAADRKGQDQGCAFSALGHAAAPGADPVLLLAAIAFVLALGIAPGAPLPLRRRTQLRPPLRGPPATA